MSAEDVVPSPAYLLVLPALCFSNFAPNSCYLRAISIDLSTVTPSLVILGSPPSYSREMLRPPGPKVSWDTWARRVIPLSTALLLSSPKRIFTVLYFGGNVRVGALGLRSNVKLTFFYWAVCVTIKDNSRETSWSSYRCFTRNNKHFKIQ